MFDDEKFVTSPSRTYVAVCYIDKERPDGNSRGYDAVYFRKFTLPVTTEFNEPLENNANHASWYFLNRLDYAVYINTCIPFEQYQDLRELI